MDESGFHRVMAVHASWRGILRLSRTDQSVLLEGLGSTGTYRLSEKVLTVNWDAFPPEVFHECSGIWLQENIFRELPDLDRMFAVRTGDRAVMASRVHVIVPGTNYEVGLRLQTSDIPTFFDTFIKRDYESPDLPESAATIVDLGANIGLATVFFGLRYPAARILSVEPEQTNFNAMAANVAALGDRISLRREAVWTTDGFVNLHREDDQGRSLGDWGVRVSDTVGKTGTTVPCRRLTSLLDSTKFAEVDILKVDIEGAELEIFSHAAAGWLPRVKLIIVETHDRFRPGTDDAVRRAVQAMFEELPASGENLLFRRREG